MPNKIFIQGYGYSGMTAVYDFLQEFENVQQCKFFEFDLCRASGGIFELGELIDNGSIYTHDSMLKRFKKLVHWFSGYFDHNLASDFLNLSEKFINDMLMEEVETDERFFSVSEKIVLFSSVKKESSLRRFIYKLLSRPLEKKLLKRIKKINFDKNVYYLKQISKEEYISHARKYLDNVFNLLSKDKTIVLCHPLSILQDKIDTQLKYFNDYKVIIIDRDPRDIFVTMSRANEQYLGITKNINGFIQSFIQRRVYHEHNIRLLGSNVFRLNFEDLILNYDETINKLNEFLGFDEKNHIYKKQKLNPENSIKTIGHYKGFENQVAIKNIEESLARYLYTQ